MDSHQPFTFDWRNHEPAYNQQDHGLFGGPPQPASSTITFEAPFQDPFQAGKRNEVQSNDDALMAGVEEEEQPVPPVATAPPTTGFSRRAKGEQLDWNAYKDTIKSLYIEQKLSLAETMKAMEDLHSFKAS